uniref:Cytochrome c biogenesis protein transmembrane region n=1 Tax=Cumathamnion serrulatum TaxID=1206573 RepID=A0A7U1AQY8_9FLOR|nr:cytochrome c biogenesis protein transmembrane region [Cumathamnion serrulatum]QQY85302.1 cytochrome c biogenesis protein transmembrane region [Cumathamnion serrulatum]
MSFIFNLWYQYEVFLYNLEQQIASFLFLEITVIKPVIILVLFFSGILTSLTPCFISIIPLSISYINSNYNGYNHKNVLLLGILTSLFIIIFSTSFANYGFLIFFKHIPFISFFILMIIALDLLQVLSLSNYFNSLYLNKLSTDSFYNNSIFKSYFTGCIIGFTTAPCSSPIILLINFWLHHSNQALFSSIYLIIYLLGCIIPLILLFNIVLNYLQLYILTYIWNIIVPCMGCFLLSISTFLFLDKLFV